MRSGVDSINQIAVFKYLMNKCIAFADEISSLLQNGVCLGPDSQGYIDSTLSNPSPARVKAVLSDPEHCERDTLIELIFFPDPSVQLKLEDLIESGRFNEQDQDQVVRLLEDRSLQTRIRFADDRQDIRMPLPPEAIEPFIARLCMTVRLPDAIIHHCDQRLPPDRRGHVKVRLRNARLTLVQNQIRILTDMLSALADDNDLLVCMDFVLDVMAESAEKADFETVLVKKRRALARDIKKMQKFQLLLEQDNIETLVMRGERIPLIDIGDAQKKIAMIDKISLMMFGTTDTMHAPAVRSDHIQCNSAQELKQIVRRFS